MRVRMPHYDPVAHGCGIVHIGTGAFHKAHQAVYTDTALEHGGDWRITGVSLRSADVARTLNPQNGRYLLLTRDEEGDSARLIASIDRVLVAPDDPEAVIAAIADPATRIVTITVTEKGYGVDRATGGLDPAHPAIAQDLAAMVPTGLIGFLVAGLARRKTPLTILSCDNLPENGHITRRLVTEFARHRDPALADWITKNVRFPSSMVDRITPAATDKTLADAAALLGHPDAAAVETEPFTQWVIEDDFAAGRPAWDKAGAVFVADVAPYEKMKLRMLNGAHSLLAYAGFIAGYDTVAEAMKDANLRRIAERQMIAAAATLPPVPGIDLDAYRVELLARFANSAIAHRTYQIAMDGTEKLPQRIMAPMAESDTPEAFAFALAAWMRYCVGRTESGETYALRDPREAQITAVLAGAEQDAARIQKALSPLLPPHDGRMVAEPLRRMLKDGMATTIAGYGANA
ncbi:mannitol dehydrogenase family protein [Falsirhodobacter sp. 1013]|uniref:mannitol dehydrogenase family protein n=1 Tax=Falsirhodobacter sp. 1013 TaxID=3417566 RepID=UPI003EB943E4